MGNDRNEPDNEEALVCRNVELLSFEHELFYLPYVSRL
jgi:hypothetical protein